MPLKISVFLNHKCIWPKYLEYHRNHFHLDNFCTSELELSALLSCSPKAGHLYQGEWVGSRGRQTQAVICLSLSSFMTSLGVAGYWFWFVFLQIGEWMLPPSLSQTQHYYLGSIVRLSRTDLDLVVSALTLTSDYCSLLSAMAYFVISRMQIHLNIQLLLFAVILCSYSIS